MLWTYGNFGSFLVAVLAEKFKTSSRAMKCVHVHPEHEFE